jgi:flagellin-like hook-associated protein FlgL
MAGSLTSVTNYAQLLDIQRSLFGQQRELAGLQQELSTGRKRDGLVGIAAVGLQQQGLASDAIRIQQYRQTSVQSTIYLRAVDTVEYRTDLYSKALNGLNTIAKDMKSELIKTKSLGPASYAAQYGLVNGALQRIESILNQTDGQRTLFSGSAYGTSPVVSISNLDASPPTALPAFAPFTGAPGNGPPRGAFTSNAAGTTTTIVSATTFPTAAIGQAIRLTTGANAGHLAQITGVLPAGTLTFTPAAPAATAAGDSFAVPYQAIQTNSALPVTLQFRSDSATVATDVAPGYINAGLRTTLITTAGESINQRSTVYIDDQLPMTYGISAAEPAMQNLINGLRNYKIALGHAINTNAAIVPPAQQQDIGRINAAIPYLDQAEAQLNKALLDVASLEGVNGGRQAQLVQIRAKHLDVVSTSDVGASRIEAVDIGEVSTRIKGIQTSLEASYITTRQILELSLVRFLR